MADDDRPEMNRPYKTNAAIRRYSAWSLMFILACAGQGLTGCEKSSPTPPPATNDSHDDTTTAPTADLQTVTIDGRTFHLELALDADTRLQGFSDREHIDPDGGMLFVFPQVVPASRLQFVMRRCLVPIDIIFLGPNGRVLATHAMEVEPFDTPEMDLKRYGSGYPGQFAIELAGGTLETLNVQPGDAIDLPYADLKARAR